MRLRRSNAKRMMIHWQGRSIAPSPLPAPPHRHPAYNFAVLHQESLQESLRYATALCIGHGPTRGKTDSFRNRTPARKREMFRSST
jgi:hypothetical protein